LAARPVKRGERLGMHWVDVVLGDWEARQPLVNDGTNSMTFFPRECHFPAPERKRIKSNHLLACFARAVNHACPHEATAELVAVVLTPEEAERAMSGDGVDGAALEPYFRPAIRAWAQSLGDVGFREEGDKRVTMRLFYMEAKRDLAAGEEISYSYPSAPGYVDKPAFTNVCEEARHRVVRGDARAEGYFPFRVDAADAKGQRVGLQD
jgi:hypothetical protein